MYIVAGVNFAPGSKSLAPCDRGYRRRYWTEIVPRLLVVGGRDLSGEDVHRHSSISLPNGRNATFSSALCMSTLISAMNFFGTSPMRPQASSGNPGVTLSAVVSPNAFVEAHRSRRLGRAGSAVVGEKVVIVASSWSGVMNSSSFGFAHALMRTSPCIVIGHALARDHDLAIARFVEERAIPKRIGQFLRPRETKSSAVLTIFFESHFFASMPFVTSTPASPGYGLRMSLTCVQSCDHMLPTMCAGIGTSRKSAAFLFRGDAFPLAVEVIVGELNAEPIGLGLGRGRLHVAAPPELADVLEAVVACALVPRARLAGILASSSRRRRLFGVTAERCASPSRLPGALRPSREISRAPSTDRRAGSPPSKYSAPSRRHQGFGTHATELHVPSTFLFVGARHLDRELRELGALFSSLGGAWSSQAA